MPSQNLSGGGTKVLTETDLTDDKADVAIPVEYTVGATFTVRLPSSIELTNNAGSWDYTGTVGVKGDIDSGNSVKVIPDETITMYDVTNRPTDDVPANADDQAYDHKDARNVAVTQTKQQWTMQRLSYIGGTDVSTDLTLDAGEMPSGRWKGKLNFQIEMKPYTINVINGKVDECKNGYYVITSDEAEEGMKFSHWEDESGNILSYNEDYCIYPEKDITVKAVYVEDTVVVEKKGTAQIVESYYDYTEGKAYVVAFLSVPRGCRINKAGLVGTKDASTGADETAFVAGNTNVTVIADASEEEYYRYTMRTSNPAWIVRPYLNYTDTEGNIVEVYGDVIAMSTLFVNQ